MTVHIRLFLDEDSQRTSLIQALRARRIDLETASEVGLLQRPDSEILAYAAQAGRVVFTFNRGDFYRLHTQWLTDGKHHAGIVISDQIETGLLIKRLLRLLANKSSIEMQDWLEFLSNW